MRPHHFQGTGIFEIREEERTSITIASTPTLEDKRLRLEPLTLAHLPALEAVALDPKANEQIWRYMLSKPKTPKDLRAWADAALKAKEAGTSMPWVTILKASHSEMPDKIIGSSRYLDLDLTHKTVEIGHTWLHPAFHGSGVNAEAKFLQLRHAFETLNLNRVALKTHHENLQSQAATRKLGAVYEGTFRNHYIMPDGGLRHSVWFSITREDWPEVKAKLEERIGLSTQPAWDTAGTSSRCDGMRHSSHTPVLNHTLFPRETV